ncbi:MAG: hypothetical protein HGN29_14360 [Asgard group archaeon]|nr:hypothetical protein [Asgard group archaeon]
MDNSPQDEPQTFASFLNLVKKLEKVIQETPELSKEEKVKEEDSKGISGDISASEELASAQIVKESELEEFEKHTDKIKKEEGEIKIKEKSKLKEGTIEYLLKIEEQLIQYYSGTEVQLEDFYFKIEDISDEQIVRKIKSKFHSLENISIRKKLNLGFPFALFKIDGKYKITVPISTGEMAIPAYVEGSRKHLKLQSIGSKDIPSLDSNEINIWNQAMSKLQLKIAQILNFKAKDDLRKISPKDIQLVDADILTIQEFIKGYEKKIIDVKSFSNEIYTFLDELKQKIPEGEGIWKDFEEFLEASTNLKEQIASLQKKHKELSKETQIEYLKLRKDQRQINGKTKRYKIEEKRGKEITREKKKALVTNLREFQSKKKHLQRDIDKAKEIQDTVDLWNEILLSEDQQTATQKIRENYDLALFSSINGLLEEGAGEDIFGKIREFETSIDQITIHVIYIPAIICEFRAVQNEKKIEGKMAYFNLTKEITFFKPALV